MKKNIIFFIIIFMAISTFVFLAPLNNLDEVWNFNFAKNIADGLVPYKDFNIIQTPLLPIICGIILKLFGTELIVIRILSVIFFSLMFFITYKIANKLKINTYITYFFLICLYLLLYNNYALDYNYASLFVVLLTIYCEIKHVQNREILYVDKKDFFIGILVASTILFKHTTGLFISAIFVFYKVLTIRNKQDIKNALRIVIYRLYGIAIPILILILYLMFNGVLNDFIDYAIKGIGTFSNKISYIKLLKNYGIHISILGILVPTTILYLFYKTVIKYSGKYKMLFILFSYSFATFIFVYPISDSIHFIVASYVTLIALIYLSSLKIEDKNATEILTNYFKSVVVISAVILLGRSIYIFSSKTIQNLKYTNIQHFKYMKSTEEVINKIDSFIINERKSGKKVYILDAAAAIYTIPLDIYNKDYDMFLKGNLGAKGELGQIEKLESEENIKVLIKNKKYKRNWQNPEQVRNYIIQNWTHVGDISQFSIYEKRGD